MTPPGLRLRALSLRWCSDRARRRLIDPALADFQAECAAARRTGSRARVFRTLVAGYLAMAKVLVIAACGDLRAASSMTAWQPAERAGARAGAWIALMVARCDGTPRGAGLDGHGISTWLPSTFCRRRCRSACRSAWRSRSRGRCAGPRGREARRRGAGGDVASAGHVRQPEVARPGIQSGLPRELAGPVRSVRRSIHPRATGINEFTWSGSAGTAPRGRARADTGETRGVGNGGLPEIRDEVTPVAIVGLVVALAFRRPWTRAGLTSVALAVCAVNYAAVMSARAWSDSRTCRPSCWGGRPTPSAASPRCCWRGRGHEHRGESASRLMRNGLESPRRRARDRPLHPSNECGWVSGTIFEPGASKTPPRILAG